MKIILFANTDWYLFNFRRSLAVALMERGDDVLLLSPPGKYGELLLRMGFRWEAVPMQRRSLNPLRELAFLWRLSRVFQREQPDLVHGFTIKCAIYSAFAGCVARVPAKVSSIAGLGYVFVNDSLRASMLRPLVKLMLRTTLGGRRSRLILQNPDDVRLIEEAGIAPRARIRLILGSGVNCGVFLPSSSDVAPNLVRVLLPARLLWDKGLAEYAEAGRLLRQRGVPVELLLAGAPDEGNPASVSAKTVREWSDAGVLRWLGHVDDMAELYRSVQIVALPSYREGLPKGLIEAGASGCALIASDVPGCREVVVHEKTGLRVPVKDGVALADAIERLVRDEPLRKSLGNSARIAAVTGFDESIVVSKTIDVYRELA